MNSCWVKGHIVWTYTTDKYTAITWVKHDGWHVNIARNGIQKIIGDRGPFKTKSIAQHYAEIFISKQESESSKASAIKEQKHGRS